MPTLLLGLERRVWQDAPAGDPPAVQPCGGGQPGDDRAVGGDV